MKIITKLFNPSVRKDGLGLCLSGGGALGFAHIGVLQSLEDHGIFPTHLSGSSMGAVVGVLYAAGYSPKAMLQLIREDKLYKVTKLMTFRPVFKSGLSTHTMLCSLIRELVPHNSFDELKKKMQVCVVNLNTGEWEMIGSGNKLDVWVAASATIPGIFAPIKEGVNYYVDGGLLNNLPAQGLAASCHTIIGVDVIPRVVPVNLKNTVDTVAFSVRTLLYQNSKEGRKLCRYLIEPRAIDEFHEFSFDAYQAIYQSGYSAATKYIVDNPEVLKLAEV